MNKEGDINIDSYGIATCYGNGSITVNQSYFPSPSYSAFSFLPIQLSSDSKINFGVLDENCTIDFDYYDFISKRMAMISPQIPIDGVGLLIQLYIDASNDLQIFINGEKFSLTYDIKSRNFSFYLKIANSFATQSIFATSCYLQDLTPNQENKHLYQQIPISSLQRFFPSYEPSFNSLNVQNYGIHDFSVCIVKPFSPDFHPLYSTKPLQPLPGFENTYYYEIKLKAFRHENSHLMVGITSEYLPNNLRSGSIPIFQEENAFYYRVNHRSAQVSGEHLVYKNKRAETKLLSGRTATFTLGFGIQSGKFFATVNGVLQRLNINLTIQETNAEIPLFYPFCFANTNDIDFEFNFGQDPFLYSDLIPPKGWCTYYPTIANPFSFGPTPNKHILNLYTSIGRSRSQEIISVIHKDELPDSSRYEVHFLYCDNQNSDLIGCGFGNVDFMRNKMVGWDDDCVGLHSDDGRIFNGAGFSRVTLVNDKSLKEGVTETIQINNGDITYYSNRTQYPNAVHFNARPYPAVSVDGHVQIILNFGETPFLTVEPDSQNPQATTLFNNLKIELSNSLIKKIGLEIGDIFESHDRSIRGEIAGSTDTIIYAYLPTFDGAFPLVENTLYDFLINYRIVYRKQSYLQRIITANNSLVIDISKTQMGQIYATPHGLSLFLGTDFDNDDVYVFRPLSDLFNNSYCFAMSELPPKLLDILETNNVLFTTNLIDSKPDPKYSNRFQLFDVISLDDTQYLVLGRDKKANNNKSVIVWNGKEVKTLDPSNSVLLLNPLGFKISNHNDRHVYIRGRLPDFRYQMYCGMLRGGRPYPIAHYGAYGTNPESLTSMQHCFPFHEGDVQMPPILNYLFNLLNEYILKGKSYSLDPIKPVEQQITTEQSYEWMYSAEDSTSKLKNNLICLQHHQSSSLLSLPKISKK